MRGVSSPETAWRTVEPGGGLAGVRPKRPAAAMLPAGFEPTSEGFLGVARRLEGPLSLTGLDYGSSGTDGTPEV